MFTMITVDTERGYDVAMREKGEVKVIAHYDNYEDAKERASRRRGYFVRYWEKKPEPVKG